jgi:beta-carotene ketolase (CrtW type)
MLKSYKNKGVIIAFAIILGWVGLLFYLLVYYPINYYSPFTYLLFLLQTHLYTGLFITAHDSMHGIVSKNRYINEWIGRICTTLFAFNFYSNLYKKHHLHHRFVATEKDPDYHTGGFWAWYLKFALEYVNFWQILMMAITYNLLKLYLPTENLIVYWMLPSIVSTFQLFYFGTYLPHKGEHEKENIHKARSQKKNHFWAFMTCYFFGYHYEHHASPATPWWLLYTKK